MCPKIHKNREFSLTYSNSLFVILRNQRKKNLRYHLLSKTTIFLHFFFYFKKKISFVNYFPNNTSPFIVKKNQYRIGYIEEKKTKI